ncbi:PBS lyase heat domain protein repeat-containing protein [Solidesulfovibrio carbinoliphilus subsp. oakridgensis]|uniref:PBS lyase heat domain protein repeat-containing protein n=1 Tax=Solidesulfovibrio carbinoliphilus subsp. oakridgensis TaxID=694327 RepID=G7QCI0_9BACT|nr:PBS lyase [Solidesulfovibrio carbinoliphilus]EHJ46136.1 PBS lyase heat domain protein repeat-containing protein [Solidesulfovibrio carbinoliphilus subsp. oakridgensis]
MTDYVALVPEDEAGAVGPGLADRLAGLAGRERLAFPPLGADPAGLAGVLLLTPGRPGTVTVNGRPATPLWRRGGRLLFSPELFRRHENVVALGRGAGEPRLAPVVADAGRVRDLDLWPETAWRMQTLSGADLGPAPARSHAPVCAPGLLDGLARGLGAMVAPDGEVWSFYDLEAATFRLSGWRWDTGIVLEGLAAAAAAGIGAGSATAARTVGDRLLAVRLADPACPGGFPEWTDLRYFPSPRQVCQWVVPFNAAFVAAGLMRLADLTGLAAYREAARESLLLAAASGLTPAGGVAGYYFEDARQWRYLGQINDSGVLGRGLALFPDEAWASTAAARAGAYILGKAARPDGHIGRAWWDPDGARPAGAPLFPEWAKHPGRMVAKVFLRGQAWVLMGLAGAVRLGANRALADGARQLADFVLAAQQADGSWRYSQNQPELGACAKTTAALALALAEWSKASGDAGPLPAVSRALGYLETCRRPDVVPPELAGMPVDTSGEGCIVYFRDRPVVCAYAGALELLARLAVGERP